ncbi:alanine-zipper protein [Thioalkalicoccus limnaeus]|uniref:Alanine-zipper protein n=1 Tax=Thioalkalicoccus limnaeus TaxID=120681 RepID=A0ABV4BAI6_9GAMM
MTPKAKVLALTATALFGASLLGGCATDQQARDMAMDALNKANAAQACCDANQARIDRMYQKIMSK